MDVKPVECIACEVVVDHTPGPRQLVDEGGSVVLFWWTCAVCGQRNFP